MKCVRVLTLIESPRVISGPARILLEFGKRAAIPEAGMPAVQVIVTTYRRPYAEDPLAVTARRSGLSVFTISERRRFDTEVIPQLRQIVDECQPDILETRNVKSHFLVRMLGLHRKYPWVAWNHGYTAQDWLDRSYNQLDRWSLRGAYRVVTVCGPFARRLERRGIDPSRITVLHNFAKPFSAPAAEDIELLRRSLGLNDELVILAVGRLSSEKGHAELLRAAATLDSKRNVPDFRIIVAGDGPEETALHALAARLGIEGRVIMVGFQKELSAYYGLATLLALPSYTEGSPNVVLEAMAAGLPIAATGVGGVPEILDHGITGLVVPPRNAQALATAITRLLTDSTFRQKLGTAARARAESNYTPEAYRRALVSFYLDTLAAR